MIPLLDPSAKPSRSIVAWYGFLAVLAVVAYLRGLDSPHIPKNGDEYPYAHITRLTAASGHFLPLRSELSGMRNTKPPLLFWQGIESTDHGRRWTLWNLRYPSVLYTLLAGLLVYLLGARLSGQPRDRPPGRAELPRLLQHLQIWPSVPDQRPGDLLALLALLCASLLG